MGVTCSRAGLLLWIAVLATPRGGAAAANLVRNPGFELAGGTGVQAPEWQTGAASRRETQARHSGTASLYVVGSAVQTAAAVKPRTGYRCSVWARRDEQGLTRLMVADAAGNPIAATDNGGFGMPAWSGPFDWQRIELAFRTVAHTAVSLYLMPIGGQEKAWFDDVELVQDDTVRVGDVSPTGAGLPRLSAAERRRGYVCFVRDTLERTYDTTVPTRREIAGRLRLRAVPGQYESAVLGVRALRALEGLQASASDLKGPHGYRLEAGRMQWRVVRPSRRDVSSVSYLMLPLFLPEARPAGLAADTTRAFWLTLHVPEDAPPGRYRGAVTVRAQDAPETHLPLEVEVRPLRLLPAPIAFGMYYNLDLLPKEYRTKEHQRRYYEDMRAHGMTSVTTYNRPALVAEAGQERLAFDRPRDDYLGLDDEMALLRDAGPYAPDVPLLYLGSFLRQQPSGPKVTEAIRRHQREKGWPEFLFYVEDEPSLPDRIETAKKELARYAGLAGVRTVTAGLDVEQLGRLYDVWIQSVDMGEATRRRAAEWGKQLWAYDCQLHGATPQHDRYLAGLYAWRWRLGGLFQWVYAHFPERCVTRDGEWRGTDSWQYGYVLAGPDGPIATLGWEGRREGVYDYRYLHTLEALVSQVRAGASPRVRAIAAEGARFLDHLRSRIRADAYSERPANMGEYATSFIPQPEITPAVYDRIRETAARYIARLQAAPTRDQVPRSGTRAGGRRAAGAYSTSGVPRLHSRYRRPEELRRRVWLQGLRRYG